MPEKKHFTAAQIIAATIEATVENKTLDECLRKIGLSEEQLFKESVYSKSSDDALRYSRELMSEKIEGLELRRTKDSFLYVVKKVLCNPLDYDSMAEAVSCEDTDKFKVLRLIGSDAGLLKYKQKNPGIEAYLVAGKNSLEAMRKTTAKDPALQYNGTNVDPEDIKRYDEIFTDIIYTHTPESVERFISSLKHLF
jgi:hypothetical protein